jgi:hypothetical protein
VSDDLHSKIRTALTAQLETARAATPGPWARAVDDELASANDYPTNAIGNWFGAYAQCVSYSGTGIGEQADRDAAHIAANAPDVTITRVEALLRILDRHSPRPLITDPLRGEVDPWAPTVCRECDADTPCPTACDLAGGLGIEVNG